jgi:hypothetical protein
MAGARCQSGLPLLIYSTVLTTLSIEGASSSFIWSQETNSEKKAVVSRLFSKVLVFTQDVTTYEMKDGLGGGLYPCSLILYPKQLYLQQARF